MGWRDEVKQIMTNSGCSDADLENFLSYLKEHPELDQKEVWNYVYELNVPEKCKGCKHVQSFNESYPCNACIRHKVMQDFYETR